MGPLAVGMIVEIRQTYRINGAFAMNTFHYRVAQASSTAGPSDLSLVVGAFDELVGGPIAQLQSNQVTNRIAYGQVIYPLRYASETFPSSLSEGQVEGAAAPSGVSLVIRRRGPLANRSSQGRIFVPGLPNLYIDANNSDPAINATILTLVNATLTALSFGTDGSAVPVLFNRTSPIDSISITDGSYDPELRYQRRREPSVGL